MTVDALIAKYTNEIIQCQKVSNGVFCPNDEIIRNNGKIEVLLQVIGDLQNL